MVTDDFWQRAQDLFDRVRMVPIDRRAAELDAACAGHAELRAEVESLLLHDTHTGPAFLESPGARLRRRLDGAERWAAELLGRRIGNYQLVRLIAAGGMGCVFEARQQHPDRAVAVKLLRPGFSATSALARFRVEPEILGRLQHPSIAQVYEAGVHDGPHGAVPFFAMELVPRAQTLAEFVNSRSLSLNRRLAIFVKACDAVHYAHQKGIIHRDLKPANILVNADGEPKIIDFGVARATDSDVMLTTQCTHVGDLVGTLRYMSPEQCDGNAAKIDTRSDIYSLGVVLYELLTGVAPYEMAGTTLYAAIRVIKEEPARPPSDVNRALRGDLDAVLLKALEKEPSRRYASSAALADDLRRVLAHEPVSVRPPGLVYVIGRYLRRRAWQSVASALALLGFLSALVFLVIDRQHRALRNKEAEERARADYRGRVQAAEGALSANDGAGAAHELSLIDETAPRLWERAHLESRVDQSVEVHRIREDRTCITGVSVDRAARFVIQEAHPGPCVDIYDLSRRTVRPIDALVLQELYERAVKTAAGPVSGGTGTAISPDGALLAIPLTADLGGLMSLVDTHRGREIRTWPVEGVLRNPQFHPCLPVLACVLESDRKHELRFWSFGEGSTVGPSSVAVDMGDHYLDRIAFSRSGEYFAGPDGGGVRLWKAAQLLGGLATPDDSLYLAGHGYNCTDVRFSPDSQLLVSCSTDRTVRIWDLQNCFAIASRSGERTIDPREADALLLTGPTAGLRCVTFDDTAGLICAGDDNGVIWVWKHERRLVQSANERERYWELVNTLRGHSGQVTSIHALSDGRLLSSAEDGHVRIWNPLIEDLPRFRNHRTSVVAVTVTADGKRAVSGDGSYAMVVWDVESGAALARVANPLRAEVRALASWTAGGADLVAAAYRSRNDVSHGRLVVWKLDERARPRVAFEYFGPSGDARSSPAFHCVAVSQDGRRLAAGDSTGSVHVLQLTPDGQQLLAAASHRVHDGPVLGIAPLDSAGDWLVATSGIDDYSAKTSGHAVRICRGDTGAPLGDPLPGSHDNSVRGIHVRFGDAARGADLYRGLQMATSSADGLICLWDIQWSGSAPQITQRQVLEGHQDGVLAVVFHPTQPRLVSSGLDRTVRVWDTEGGAAIVTLRGAKGMLNALAFDRAGRRLLAACGGVAGVDNALILWDSDVPAGRSARELRAIHTRWRTNVRDAVQRYDTLTRPDLLLDGYVDYLAEVATAERWPERVLNYAKEHFTAFVHDVDGFTTAAWNVVSDQGRSEADYARALQHAARATELDPWNVRAHTTVGGALYRLGRHGEAVAALNRAQALVYQSVQSGEHSSPPALAFLAMASAQLGQLDAAEEALRALRESLCGQEHESRTDLAGLLMEAEGLVSGPP